MQPALEHTSVSVGPYRALFQTISIPKRIVVVVFMYLVLARLDDEVPALRTQVPRTILLEHGRERPTLLDISENSVESWIRQHPRRCILCWDDPRNSEPAPTIVHRHRNQCSLSNEGDQSSAARIGREMERSFLAEVRIQGYHNTSGQKGETCRCENRSADEDICTPMSSGLLCRRAVASVDEYGINGP